MPSIGSCPWRLSFFGGFAGVSLWLHIYISQLEHCNYNIETPAFLRYLPEREWAGANNKIKINCHVEPYVAYSGNFQLDKHSIK